MVRGWRFKIFHWECEKINFFQGPKDPNGFKGKKIFAGELYNNEFVQYYYEAL